MSSQIMITTPSLPKRRHVKLILGAVGLSTLALLGVAKPAKAGYSIVVNGYGYGFVFGEVECANGNYASVFDPPGGGLKYGASASIPPRTIFTGNTAPLPRGCSSGTFMYGGIGPFWTINANLGAVNGGCESEKCGKGSKGVPRPGF